MADSILDRLLNKQEQLANRIKNLKSKQSSQKRKDDTARKILAGAYVISKHQKEGTYDMLISELDKFLSVKRERALFGLPEREEKNTKKGIAELV